ncbi:MAG: dienelactone hydrolase family protein, partial [Verrucomicrobiota bacterium]
MRAVLFIFISILVCIFPAWGEETNPLDKPRGELIFLRDFGTDEVGYLSIPQMQPKAGVVVVHGKHGLSTSLRKTCDDLADRGYLALAVDLFNGRIPKSQKEVAEITGAYTIEAATAAIQTGVNFFELSPRFRMEKVVVLGIGEGTRDVISMARKGKGVSGIVLLDPDAIPNRELLNQMNCPVLALISASRDFQINVDEINNGAGVNDRLDVERLPEVLIDSEDPFQRHINDQVWGHAMA